MYYTGLDPRTMKPVYVPTNPHEKAMQRALIQYRNPKNYYLVREALEQAGRQDLIGFEKKCLIRPYPPGQQPPYLRGKPIQGKNDAAKRSGGKADHKTSSGSRTGKGTSRSAGVSAASGKTESARPATRGKGWAVAKKKPNRHGKK